MPNTGSFYLVNVEGVEDRGHLLQVTKIDARCLQCSIQFRALPSLGLVDHDGAASLTCPECGNHQAISRSRLEDFRKTA